MDDSLKVLRREYDDMFYFRFALPSMRAGLVNRSRPCLSVQDKGRVDGLRQTGKSPASRKRKHSPKKKGVSVKHRQHRLSPSAANSSSVVGLEEDFKISPEKFDEGHYCKFDGDAGFGVMEEFSDAWLANDDPDDLLCAASIDDLIRDGLGEEGFVCSTTERSRSTSFDDLDLVEEILESWANQFGLSLE
jgi:hypothetical protein